VARKKKHPEHVNHERWLVSYADFITLLFAFFTTLYAISTVDQKKVGKLMYSMRTAFDVDFFPGQAPASAAVAPPAGSPISLVPLMEGSGDDGDGDASENTPGHPAGGKGASYDEVREALEKLAATLDGAITVREERRGVVVSLSEATLFSSGSAEILATGVAALEQIAARLAEAEVVITVEGHTDNVPMRSGRYASNWELSTARATSVVEFALQRGIAPRQLSAAGYGEHWPVASNSTPEGRARNRRVDLVVRPAVKGDHDAVAPPGGPDHE
jgi:chemotaxis protein MotB